MLKFITSCIHYDCSIRVYCNVFQSLIMQIINWHSVCYQFNMILRIDVYVTANCVKCVCIKYEPIDICIVEKVINVYH